MTETAQTEKAQTETTRANQPDRKVLFRVTSQLLWLIKL